MLNKIGIILCNYQNKDRQSGAKSRPVHGYGGGACARSLWHSALNSQRKYASTSPVQLSRDCYTIALSVFIIISLYALYLSNSTNY